MTGIKRYDASLGHLSVGPAVFHDENPDGGWVKYEDHVAALTAAQQQGHGGNFESNRANVTIQWDPHVKKWEARMRGRLSAFVFGCGATVDVAIKLMLREAQRKGLDVDGMLKAAEGRL